MRPATLSWLAWIFAACLVLGISLPVNAQGATPEAVTVAPTPEPTYPTANGPRTATELQRELTAAGYAGPWDIASMLEAYGRAAQPRIDAYPDDRTYSCLASNPSCANDPWWSEWNTLQDDTRVTYTAIGSSFATERRFAEAVNLLWQWPEGKSLLHQADRLAVGVMTLDYDEQSAYASYVPDRNVITVNRRYVTAPTWMLAAVLAHELSHSLDDSQNRLGGANSADCIARETHAFEVTHRYLVWLTRTLHPEGLPSIAAVSGRLSTEHGYLAADLYDLGGSTNVAQRAEAAYAKVCGVEAKLSFWR